MGWELRRGIRDALPPRLLTQGERAVLLELADYANKDTRRAWPGIEELARAVDMTPTSVGTCLSRMAKKGIEVRVAIGKDSKGRPVYAYSGRQTNYLLPTPDEVRMLRPSSDQKVGPPSDQPARKGPTVVEERSDGGREKVRPSSDPSRQETQEPTSSSRPSYLTRVAELTDTDDDEATALINHIKANTNIRKSIGAYLAGISQADLVDHLATMRTQRQPTQAAAAEQPEDLAAFRDFKRSLLTADHYCDHGVRGGHLQMPGTGWVACHIERARLAALTAKDAS